MPTNRVHYTDSMHNLFYGGSFRHMPYQTLPGNPESQWSQPFWTASGISSSRKPVSHLGAILKRGIKRTSLSRCLTKCLVLKLFLTCFSVPLHLKCCYFSALFPCYVSDCSSCDHCASDGPLAMKIIRVFLYPVPFPQHCSVIQLSFFWKGSNKHDQSTTLFRLWHIYLSLPAYLIQCVPQKVCEIYGTAQKFVNVLLHWRGWQ